MERGKIPFTWKHDKEKVANSIVSYINPTPEDEITDSTIIFALNDEFGKPGVHVISCDATLAVVDHDGESAEDLVGADLYELTQRSGS